MNKRNIWIGCLMVLSALLLAACDREEPKTFTVGILNILPTLDDAVTGFKEGMAELGYVEGRNIRYLYEQPSRDMSKLVGTAENLAANRADLILTITTPATLAAKKATADSGLPVVFAIVTDPLGAGIVDNIQHPGGNVTGVTFGPQEPRRLEWLLKLAPTIKQIYVPFNPQDKAPVLALTMVQAAAKKLGVELITREVFDSASLEDAVSNIPAAADAIFLLPDTLRGTRLADMVNKATELRLPVSVSNTVGVREYGMLTSYGFDLRSCGKQAARLADQVFKGTRPADLPVETAKFYLAINLKVARAIHLDIPDEILRQADIIVR